MARRTNITWAELRVGLFVLASLTLLGFFGFYFTGGGRLFTSKVDYVTYLPSVSGLSGGAPVRLNGFTVGSVDSIELRDFGDDPSRATLIHFRVSEGYQPWIREDTVAYIRTEGLLGESYLEMETVTLFGKVIPGGGTVQGIRRPGVKDIVQNVGRITADVQSLTGEMRAGKGTLGKLLADPDLYNRANRIVRNFETVSARTVAGEGSLGRLLVNDDIYESIRNAVTNVENLTGDISSGKGSLGGFLRDRRLYDDAASAVHRVDNLMERVEAGEGTLGKLVNDDALHESLRGTFQNTAEISEKINNGEGALGRAVHDPRLYENVNNFTSELRALVSDFRKNPKKFLRVKASIF